MKRVIVSLALCLCVAVSTADDAEKPPASAANGGKASTNAASTNATSATSSVSVTAAVSAPPVVRVADAAPAPAAGDGGPAAARFETAAQWKIAGYNNEEIIYTIVVTSHDSRIIRCNTELKGSYYENGQKLSVADRQLSTVFTDQQVQVGNWMGMDEKSGATYSVKCHAI